MAEGARGRTGGRWQKQQIGGRDGRMEQGLHCQHGGADLEVSGVGRSGAATGTKGRTPTTGSSADLERVVAAGPRRSSRRLSHAREAASRSGTRTSRI